jgi:hypothetical protein
MAIQLGVASRNRRLDSIEVELGTTPIMTIRTLAQPANCAAANAGVVLATINLPSDWMAAAAGGVKTILGGPWQDVSADAGGLAAHFRVHNSAGTVCEIQGTVGQGTGDLQLDNTTLVAGQTVSITGFSLTDGNA